MIANIDDNVGRLLAKLKEWGIERDTLVIFMNDNGGTAASSVFNAGMRGQKGTPWLGGTRAVRSGAGPGSSSPPTSRALAGAHRRLPDHGRDRRREADATRRSSRSRGGAWFRCSRTRRRAWPDRYLVHARRALAEGSERRRSQVHAVQRAYSAAGRWFVTSPTAAGDEAVGAIRSSRPIPASGTTWRQSIRTS